MVDAKGEVKMQFRIENEDGFSDEDLTYIAQQMNLLGSIAALGPPDGFADWTEEEQRAYFTSIAPGYKPTPPSIGKCAESVFAISTILISMKPGNPLVSRQSEILHLGCSFGAQYLLALSVELALKHAIAYAGSKYPREHNLHRLWDALKKADPVGAEQVSEHYKATAQQHGSEVPEQGTRWNNSSTMEEAMQHRADDWEMRYWFESTPHTRETVHHGNNMLPLAIAFDAIIKTYPTVDGESE